MEGMVGGRERRAEDTRIGRRELEQEGCVDVALYRRHAILRAVYVAAKVRGRRTALQLHQQLPEVQGWLCGPLAGNLTLAIRPLSVSVDHR